MNAIFWGYHTTGEIVLRALVACGVRVLLVVLPVGRDSTAFVRVCESLGIPSCHEEKLMRNEALTQKLRDLQPDVFIVDSFDRLIPAELIAIPRLGAFNFHPSLLPRYRGQHVMNWVLINDETETGMTVHTLSTAFDTGEIVLQERISIDENDDINTLQDKLCTVLPAMVSELVEQLQHGRLIKKPQNGLEATSCRARTPEDGRINWRQPARTTYNLIRALRTPWPNAFTEYAGHRLLINEARLTAEHDSAPPGMAYAAGDTVRVVCGDARILCLGEMRFAHTGQAPVFRDGQHMRFGEE